VLKTLLAGLPVIQVGLVVADLEACARRQSATLGTGPWRVYDLGPHVIDHYVLRGEPATGHTLVALNDAHPQTEILQPLSGTSLHREWLDEHGEGLHHVGVVVDSVPEVVSAAAAEGIGVLSSGEGFGVDGTGKFAYLDSQVALGMIFEVIEPPTSLGEPDRRL